MVYINRFVTWIWLSKTREQKILALITIIFWTIDGFLWLSEQSNGDKWTRYIFLLILRFVLKFGILSFLNTHKIMTNIKSSIPFWGPFYSFFFFFTGKRKIRK